MISKEDIDILYKAANICSKLPNNSEVKLNDVQQIAFNVQVRELHYGLNLIADILSKQISK